MYSLRSQYRVRSNRSVGWRHRRVRCWKQTRAFRWRHFWIVCWGLALERSPVASVSLASSSRRWILRSSSGAERLGLGCISVLVVDGFAFAPAAAATPDSLPTSWKIASSQPYAFFADDCAPPPPGRARARCSVLLLWVLHSSSVEPSWSSLPPNVSICWPTGAPSFSQAWAAKEIPRAHVSSVVGIQSREHARTRGSLCAQYLSLHMPNQVRRLERVHCDHFATPSLHQELHSAIARRLLACALFSSPRASHSLLAYPIKPSE